ncbi:MAG: CopG family antitoxin [Chloroflexota bacterium]
MLRRILPCGREARRSERTQNLPGREGRRCTMTAKERQVMPKEPIPKFTTRRKEAEFWDTHSVADYWEEWQPMRAQCARHLSEGITLRLDPETMRRIRAQARMKGIGPTTLISMWVLERIQGAHPGTSLSESRIARIYQPDRSWHRGPVHLYGPALAQLSPRVKQAMSIFPWVERMPRAL